MQIGDGWFFFLWVTWLMSHSSSRVTYAIDCLPEVISFDKWSELKPEPKAGFSNWFKDAFRGGKNDTQDGLHQKLHFILSTAPMWDRFVRSSSAWLYIFFFLALIFCWYYHESITSFWLTMRCFVLGDPSPSMMLKEEFMGHYLSVRMYSIPWEVGRCRLGQVILPCKLKLKIWERWGLASDKHSAIKTRWTKFWIYFLCERSTWCSLITREKVIADEWVWCHPLFVYWVCFCSHTFYYEFLCLKVRYWFEIAKWVLDWFLYYWTKLIGIL